VPTNDIRDGEKVLVWQQIIVAFYLTRIETIYYLYILQHMYLLLLQANCSSLDKITFQSETCMAYFIL
jgi:hypothetical protein